jgi:hypothetical protein
MRARGNEREGREREHNVKRERSGEEIERVNHESDNDLLVSVTVPNRIFVILFRK